MQTWFRSRVFAREIANRATAGKAGFWLAASLVMWMSLASGLAAEDGKRHGATRAAQPVNAALLKQALGAGVDLAKRPCLVKGDFDGDGVQDLLALVWVDGAYAWPSDVRAIDPWATGGQSATPVALPRQRTRALAIALAADAHSAVRAWIVFDAEQLATPIWAAPTCETVLAVVARKKVSGIKRLPWPRATQGDVIGVATEAGITTFLYWDGKTFNLHEPEP